MCLLRRACRNRDRIEVCQESLSAAWVREPIPGAACRAQDGGAKTKIMGLGSVHRGRAGTADVAIFAILILVPFCPGDMDRCINPMGRVYFDHNGSSCSSRLRVCKDPS